MENVSRLEVHYHLRDGLHAMDALVRNRCEAEFLAAVAYIAQALGATLQFEATTPTEGGFRDIWRVLFDKDNRAVSATILSLLVTQAVAIWNAPAKPDKELERQQLEINRLTIDHWKLENQHSALEVKKLQREVDAASTPPGLPPVPASSTVALGSSSSYSPSPLPNGVITANPSKDETKRLGLQMDPKVRKRRSNFYKQLIPYEPVTAVGFRWLPDEQPPRQERVVLRADFSSFVLQTDTLDPEVTDAVIEIVSPVITEGDIQWKGKWNGQTISFAMDDKVFKGQVFHKGISFQHGDCIRCVLESERKLDEDGNPKVKGYRVITVLDKIEGGGKVYETPQGRRRRFEEKYADGQPDLFKGEGA